MAALHSILKLLFIKKYLLQNQYFLDSLVQGSELFNFFFVHCFSLKNSCLEYFDFYNNNFSDDSDSSSNVDDQDVEIDGFDFLKLRQLHPNLSTELTEFRNHIIESTNEMQPMKVWQLQDLSFQVRFYM